MKKTILYSEDDSVLSSLFFGSRTLGMPNCGWHCKRKEPGQD